LYHERFRRTQRPAQRIGARDADFFALAT